MSMFGSFSSWLRTKLKREQKAKILILGLDAAGKTTLTRFMRFGKFAENLTPTIGQNIESFEFEGWTITAIDVAGQSHFRFLWEAHYPGCSAVIFVIDAADIERLPEARDVLKTHVFNNPYMENVPTLIMANKNSSGDKTTLYFIGGMILFTVGIVVVIVLMSNGDKSDTSRNNSDEVLSAFFSEAT